MPSRARPSAGAGRRARGSLSADEILDAARRLVERDGLARLSMPGLARELGSGVTSIYWYFRSKEELLEAMTERVFQELHGHLPPVGDGPWDEELVHYFSAFRNLLKGNPAYGQLVAFHAHLLYQVPAGSSVLRRLDEGLGVLISAGLAPVEAARAYGALANYTRGFVVLEHGAHDVNDSKDRAEPLDAHDSRRGAWRRPLDPGRYPALSRLPADVEDPAPLDDESFLSGLRLLIAGIGAAHPAAGRST